MSYRALCELVEARKWRLLLSTQNAGAMCRPTDDPAVIWKLTVMEGTAQLASVDLAANALTLDQAAQFITEQLRAAGVYS